MSSDIEEFTKLKVENTELKAENATYKANADAVHKYITQNEQLKTHIDGLEKKNAALKAKNDRLKQEWRLDCLKCEYKNTKADVDKYKQTSQEIKAIAEELLEKGLEPQSVEHQLRLKGKRELASIILDLITKAEEE